MKILVLALGNDVLGDDAAGFIVADLIIESVPVDIKNHLKIIKSAKIGLYLLEYFLDDYDYVIIIDSIVSKEPGKILEIPVEKLKPAIAPSPHYSGIPEILEFLQNMGYRKPKLYIYAISIKEPVLGGRVSGIVLSASQRLSKLIVGKVRELLDK